MSIRDILKMGDPRLLRVAEPVHDFDSPRLHQLAADLWDTMHAAGGVGLAAPQIGVNLQVLVFGIRENSARYPQASRIEPTVLCNPQIVCLGNEMNDDWEGCLSIPGLRGLVTRCSHIRYQGMDLYGDPIEREARDFHARVVQHEHDHLQGRLYPTRMRDLRQFGFSEILQLQQEQQDAAAVQE